MKIEIHWSPPVLLNDAEAQKQFQYLGLYIHCMNWAEKKRIMYVGTAFKQTIASRLSQYATNYPKYTLFNLPKITDDLYTVITNENIKANIEKQLILPGSSDEQRAAQFAAEIEANKANSFISAGELRLNGFLRLQGKLQHIHLPTEVTGIAESILQKYLITHFGIGKHPDRHGTNLLGRIENLGNSEHYVVNVLPNEGKEWFVDLPEIIIDRAYSR